MKALSVSIVGNQLPLIITAITVGIEIDLKLHPLTVGLFVGVGGDGQHCAPEPYTYQQRQLQVEIH
jgi:hypothetical protein